MKRFLAVLSDVKPPETSRSFQIQGTYCKSDTGKKAHVKLLSRHSLQLMLVRSSAGGGEAQHVHVCAGRGTGAPTVHESVTGLLDDTFW